MSRTWFVNGSSNPGLDYARQLLDDVEPSGLTLPSDAWVEFNRFSWTSPERRQWCPSQLFFDSVANGGLFQGISWADRFRFPGCGHAPFRIAGITKDTNGVAIGNAVCKLYRTSDDVLQQTTLSATTNETGNLGNYGFVVYDSTTTFYIVAYRKSPDIEGTTENTLTGS